MDKWQVTLCIPIDNMNQEQYKALLTAEKCLREAGITFDTVTGFGERTWMLDWSLKGAEVVSIYKEKASGSNYGGREHEPRNS